jgi:hypothetical protein
MGSQMMKVQSTQEVQDFSKKITDFIEVRSFLSVFDFIVKSNVCPETDRKGWFETLCYMHTKGWIYLNSDGGKISSVVGAYRVNSLENFDTLPVEEEGEILYIPFAASVSDDKLLFKKMLDKYIEANPMVKEVVFYERNSQEKFKRFKLNEGVSNGGK